MALEADGCGFRFIVLCFNCLLTFFSYFCFDMPSVLQDRFTGENVKCNETIGDINISVNHNVTPLSLNCCEECLGMSQDEFNMLYAVYAWTNAVVVIGAGYLIDKLGNRIGLLLFSFLVLVGSGTFASGVLLRETKYMVPIMVVGRLTFGAGSGSLTIVQNRITAFWFKDRELAMAFGITLAVSRLGSVLNFFVTRPFENAFDLKWTLFGGAMLCSIGFVAAIILSALDLWGVRKLGKERQIIAQSKNLKFTDIKNLSLQYWLLAFTIMFFYNSVFPFVADATQFIQDKYHYNNLTASFVTGAVYDVSMLLSPFLGFGIDVFGNRAYLALICAVLSLPVFALFAYTTVPALVMTIWLGFTYSLAAPSTWPSIPLVVRQDTLGTALGLTTAIQMVGIGISNLVVGKLLGDSRYSGTPAEREHRWKYVMMYLLANVCACVVTTLILIIVDKRTGNVLNQTRKEREAKRRALMNKRIRNRAAAGRDTPPNGEDSGYDVSDRENNGEDHEENQNHRRAVIEGDRENEPLLRSHRSGSPNSINYST